MGESATSNSSTIRRKSSLEDVSTLQQYFPFLQWIRIVTKHTALSDLISGVTIGLIILPQSMSYAKMLNIEPEHGLYSALMCVVVYLFLGTSREAALGPTAVLTLVIAAALKGCREEECLAIISVATFLAGVIQVLMGFLGLGFIVTFISHAAISGFCSGAAVAVVVQQIPGILGSSYKASGIVWEDVYNIAKHIKSYDLPFNPNFILGVSSIISIILLKQTKQFAPNSRGMGLFVSSRNVFVLFIATMISVFYAYSSGKPGAEGIPFRVIGKIPSGLPSFAIPDNITRDVLIASFRPSILIAIIGFMEAYAISTSFPYSGQGTRVDASQELVAFGASNIVSSLFRGFAVTASFSRSAINASAGVRTQLHNFYVGILIAFSLLFFTGGLFYVPSACLAAVIIVGISSIFDTDTIRMYMRVGLRASKYDAMVTATAFFGTMGLGIEAGIILAIAVHSVIMLYRLSRPKISSKMLDIASFCDTDTEFYKATLSHTLEPKTKMPARPIRALSISVEGNMYYISAARVESAVKNISRLAALDSSVFSVSRLSTQLLEPGDVRATRDYTAEVGESGSSHVLAPRLRTVRKSTSDARRQSSARIKDDKSKEERVSALSRLEVGEGAAKVHVNVDLTPSTVSCALPELLLRVCQDSNSLFTALAQEEGGVTQLVLDTERQMKRDGYVDESEKSLLEAGTIQDACNSIGDTTLAPGQASAATRTSASVSASTVPVSYSPIVGVFFDLTKVNSVDSTGLHAIESACQHVILNPVVLDNVSAPFPVTSIYLVGASEKVLDILEESAVMKTIQLGFSSRSRKHKSVPTIADAMKGLLEDAKHLERRLAHALSLTEEEICSVFCLEETSKNGGSGLEAEGDVMTGSMSVNYGDKQNSNNLESALLPLHPTNEVLETEKTYLMHMDESDINSKNDKVVFPAAWWTKKPQMPTVSQLLADIHKNSGFWAPQ